QGHQGNSTRSDLRALGTLPIEIRLFVVNCHAGRRISSDAAAARSLSHVNRVICDSHHSLRIVGFSPTWTCRILRNLLQRTKATPYNRVSLRTVVHDVELQ